MTQTILSTSPSVRYALLVTLSWGGNFSKTAKYTSQAGDIILDNGETFGGLPEMEIVLPKLSGGTEDEPCDITLPVDSSPANELTTGLAHSPIRVLIEEMDVRDPATRRAIFFGEWNQTVQNPDGDPSHLKITFDGLKAKLKVALGLECGNTCPYVFGDMFCQKAIGALKETGIAVNGATRYLQVSGVTTTAFYWRRGYVECDGLVLMVRDQPEGNILILSMPAPDSWRGRPIVCTPGCNGTTADCAKWNNSAHFGGIGLKMPTVHPLYQSVQ